MRARRYSVLSDVHLLDTDTLSHLHAGNSKVAERLRRVDDPIVAITIITKIELLRGRFEFLLKAADAAQLLRAQQWLTRTEERLGELMIVGVDEKAAQEFDRLRTIAAVRKIGRADLLIASIALAYRATLVTRNLRHFRAIERLRLANWVD